MRGPRRIVGAAAVVAAALVLAWAWHRWGTRPPLPPLAHYERLPAVFDRKLAEARTAAARGDPEAVRRLARLYQANGLPAEARACYRVVAAGSGLSARDHYYLAEMAQDDNDLAGACREFRDALRAEPDYMPARLALADALFKSGRADEAAAEYTAILARQPDHSQAAFGLARIELQRRQDDAAVGRLEELLARHPEATAAAGLLARVMARRGEARRADALAQWSRQRPEPIPADPWSDALEADCCDSQHLELEAEQYLNAGQMDQALPLLDRVAELDPGSWIPPLLRGWSDAQAGHPEAADGEYRQALARGGDPEMIGPQVVNVLLAQRKFEEAAAFVAPYRARLPNSIPFLTAAAEIAVRRGDRTAAQDLLAQVLAQQPYLYPQGMQLARILWAEGRHAEAEPYLARLAEIRPRDADAQGLLAQYCLEKGDPASAVAHLESVAAGGEVPPAMQEPLRQMLAMAYLEQGDFLARRGDREQARRQWEKARPLAAGNVEIGNALDQRLGPALGSGPAP